EGVEGKFYLWTEEEIRSILDSKEADLFLSLYRHSSDNDLPGMHEIAKNNFIAHLKPLIGGQKDFSETPDIESIRDKLFSYREKRLHPHKDDKILTDWNGLMIAALARGAQVFDEPAYIGAAERAMNFILQSLQTKDGRLLHRYRSGEAAITGNVDDYSFVIWGLLELYEATFQATYLQKALDYNNDLFRNFLDEKTGGLFFTSSEAESLLTRPKELYDGAIPSGNSIAFINALRLFRITGDAAVEKQANEIYRAFRAHADAMPTAFTQFLCGLDFVIGPSSEVIIAGDMDKPDTKELLFALRKHFAPNKVVILRPEKSAKPDIEAIAPFVKSHSGINGKATAYVCTNYTCALPTNDPQKMLELLRIKK
ncbi:MAG: thioredoxin domain-containing protein, partial [Smithella sp.]|nr:thioredoxin domain-containing protein [Smithella sp.]